MVTLFSVKSSDNDTIIVMDIHTSQIDATQGTCDSLSYWWTYKAIGQNFWLVSTKGQLYSLNYRLQVQKKWLPFVNQVLWLTYCQSPIEALSFLTIDCNGNSLLSLIYCHLSIVFYLLFIFLVQISISNMVIISTVENDNGQWSCQDQLSYF